jgi:glucose-6-phosphate dehydrogenase assembly protein OpcA
VVDTGRFRSPLSTFTELATEVTRARHRTAVIDLNWARLTPWRALTAGLFDSREWRPYLDQIDAVYVELNNAEPTLPANPIAAFLALGWLASRLGWRLERHPVKVSDSHLTVIFHAAQREVTVRIQFISGMPHGRLRSLRLEASHSTPPAVFHITRASDTPHSETRVVVGDGEPMVRVAQYEHRGVAELLAEEMERLGHDATYEEALKVADAVRAMLQVEIFVPV